MIVVAIDLAHRGLATGFVIASDDRDFQPVIQYLIESGFQVLRLRKQVIAELPQTEPALRPPPVQKQATLAPVDMALKGLLAERPRGQTMQAIGSKLKGGTVKAQTGKATWRSYMNTRKDLYRIEGVGLGSTVAWIGP